MIKLYSWTTPNGRKVSIALEEMGLPYEAIAIDITKDEQFAPDFLQISPNNKIPALVDGDQSIFESGAILLYLAQKSGKFLPPLGTPAYWDVMQWLMWQMGGLGPMVGQAHHFLHYKPGTLPYAEARYHKETLRLYGVLEKQLTGRDHVCDDLSIADFAIWPWIARFDYHKVDLNDFPAAKRWYLRLADRPGFQRGYLQPRDVGPVPLP